MAVPTGIVRKPILIFSIVVAAYFGLLLSVSLSLPTVFSISGQFLLAGLIAAGPTLLVPASFTLWRHAQLAAGELAYRDDLTGLPNRRAFMSEASKELKAAKPGSIALVLFDVDGLKAINDSCGHQAGDELLRSAARYLQRAAGRRAAVFRIGGDEFALILDRSKGDRVAPFVRALSAVEVAFTSCNHTHPVNISCGFASSLEAESFESLFHRADMRMYESKQRTIRPQPSARAAIETTKEILAPLSQESLALR